MNTFDEYIDELIRFGLAEEIMSPVELHCKASEEFGELGEQILYNHGHLRHKTLDEPIENELGDLLNCVIVEVARTLSSQNVPLNEIKDRLLTGMFTKLTKYKKIIRETNENS